MSGTTSRGAIRECEGHQWALGLALKPIECFLRPGHPGPSYAV